LEGKLYRGRALKLATSAAEKLRLDKRDPQFTKGIAERLAARVRTSR
jgi:hypothetical protein